LLTFTRQADADDSDSDLTKVAIVDVHTGAVRMLTSHAKYEYQPQFSPTGSTVQYIYPHGPGPVSVMNVFFNDRNVSAHFDRDVAEAQWMPDGRSVIAMAPDRIASALWLITEGAGAHRIDLGALSVTDYDVGKSGAIALVASNASTPPELYYLAAPSSRAVKLTSANVNIRTYQYGRSVELQWTAPDGERSDGIVTYPVGYRQGHRYPLVVWNHGGPEAASLATFGGGEIGRLRYGFSSHGYIVFEPNYRGSDNLGNAHEHGIYRDPGAGPGRDVMAGIRALEKTGAVDLSKIAVVGHSYGGYMTTWLIGHEHMWRSAAVADGVTDWRQEYDFSAAGNLAWTRDSLGGTPMDPTAAPLYRSGSPISYAPAITTPTLILSGTADQTVPITESFELYHALNDRHIPVRFIGIPGAHHSPSKPVQVDRYYMAILNWVVEHM
jgi:dipeptidyl aminopeptidase/acylaminoacyl peptidase